MPVRWRWATPCGLTHAGARTLTADVATGAAVLIWETAGEPAGV